MVRMREFHRRKIWTLRHKLAWAHGRQYVPALKETVMKITHALSPSDMDLRRYSLSRVLSAASLLLKEEQFADSASSDLGDDSSDDSEHEWD
jgi:hypothetical protein